jgi:hypothetical protein
MDPDPDAESGSTQVIKIGVQSGSGSTTLPPTLVDRIGAMIGWCSTDLSYRAVV